jgi:hypothetical protein
MHHVRAVKQFPDWDGLTGSFTDLHLAHGAPSVCCAPLVKQFSQPGMVLSLIRMLHMLHRLSAVPPSSGVRPCFPAVPAAL